MVGFSLIAKLLFPRNVVDQIHIHFLKFVELKISFQSLYETMMDLGERYPPLVRYWLSALSPSPERHPPIVAPVREIVRWFYANGLSHVHCGNFVKFLSESRRTGTSTAQTLGLVLDQLRDSAPVWSISTLLTSSANLLFLLPRPPRIPASSHSTFSTHTRPAESSVSPRREIPA
jgi:hypothetical protein